MYSIKDFIDCNIVKINATNEEIIESIEIIEEEIRQDDNIIREDLVPKRPFNQFKNQYIREREMELMVKLYSAINSYLYPYVVSVVNEYEYTGSPIYSVGPDRETIAQMIDRVLEVLAKNLDQVGEIQEEEVLKYLGGWDRIHLLRSNIDSLLLTEIFTQRRPEYFDNINI